MISIFMTDATDSISRIRLHLPTGTSIGAAQTAAEGIIPLVLAVSQAQIARYSVSYQKRESDTISPRTALVASPQAQFFFSLTDTDPGQGEITIPLDTGWVLTDGPLAGVGIDLTLSEVISFTDEMRDGDWCDPFGVDLSDVLSALVREIL